jgi:proteasome lid subunit RPN8/RPN11
MSNPATVFLDPAAVQAMAEHAREAFPDECCGVLLEGPDSAVRVLRIRNIQEELHAEDPVRYPRPATIAYVGHPDDLRIALDAADQPGCRLLAFYHSHPDHDAYFSDEDLAQATPFGEPSYPDALQVVLSIYDREFRCLKAFAWSPSQERYVEALRIDEVPA